MPKMEYWKKWELGELLSDLELALTIIDKGSNESNFNNIEELKEELLNEIDDLGHWNGSLVSDWIYQSFSPRGKWAKYETSYEGEELRKRIFERISRWKEGTGYKV